MKQYNYMMICMQLRMLFTYDAARNWLDRPEIDGMTPKELIAAGRELEVLNAVSRMGG